MPFTGLCWLGQQYVFGITLSTQRVTAHGTHKALLSARTRAEAQAQTSRPRHAPSRPPHAGNHQSQRSDRHMGPPQAEAARSGPRCSRGASRHAHTHAAQKVKRTEEARFRPLHRAHAQPHTPTHDRLQVEDCKATVTRHSRQRPRKRTHPPTHPATALAKRMK